MEWLKKFCSSLRLEPSFFLYILSSYLKTPVFQALLYEKACVSRYGDAYGCSNITRIYDDKDLQSDANHLFLISLLCSLIPTIFTSLLLGSLSDSWNAKIPMTIPFVGLIIGDLNYLFQTVYMKNNVYYLMISDILFGCCGGYTAIIALTLSYNVKTTSPEMKSERIAAFEAAAGFGTTFGYALSGSIRQSVGYSYYFLMLMVIHVSSFLYIMAFAQELESQDEELPPPSIRSRFSEVFQFVDSYRHKPSFKIFTFILIAIVIQMFCSAGTQDIQYSYLQYKLAWDDKPYGWFNGLGSGFSSIAVLFLYPLLHHRYGSTDIQLAIWGFFTQMVFLLMFSFLFSHWWAYLSLIPNAFPRFILTGLRATSSKMVEYEEQGKLFSLISLLDGITGIIATLIFNGFYPLTLNFFSGTIFLLLAFACIGAIVLLLKVHYKMHGTESETTPLIISPDDSINEE
jgi:MFS family permease